MYQGEWRRENKTRQERRGDERRRDNVFYRINVRFCCGKARLERRQSDEESRKLRIGRFLDCEQRKKL
jgi:hypothetical protein